MHRSIDFIFQNSIASDNILPLYNWLSNIIRAKNWPFNTNFGIFLSKSLDKMNMNLEMVPSENCINYKNIYFYH